MSQPDPPVRRSFADLGLAEPLVRVLVELGYEAPTPIQEATIPTLLAGRDVIGQAQTGTGKTAAFGLPLLQAVDATSREVQALILTPTRELAIQVAEALHAYARYLPGIGVLPVYGGQPLEPQARRLQRGTHIVVGTPGRIMDHLRRGSLRLEGLRAVVLDEADEMLRMGFIDDVEWILEQAPKTGAGLRTALFSATMPPEIRRIASRHLKNPESVEVARKSITVPTIEQRFMVVGPQQKVEALTRLLETEASEAMLVFTRTKVAAAQVAERLEVLGYSVAAIHGDMTQPLRERVIERLRAGAVEIVVATDVAARGLDVERITHVINYDMPNDVEAYVHRIGRTGRAGRSGIAILFVTPRERRMLQEIERFTGQKIAAMTMPSPAAVASRRRELLKQSLRDAAAGEGLEPYLALVEELAEEGLDIAEVAAAAALIAGRDRPLVDAPPTLGSATVSADGMVKLYLGVGQESGMRPGDIVGALANEAGIPGRDIGAIDIHDRFSLVDVPARFAAQVLERMAAATLRGRPAGVRVAADHERALARRRDDPRAFEGAPMPDRLRPPHKRPGPPRHRERPGDRPRHEHGPRHRGKPPRG